MSLLARWSSPKEAKNYSVEQEEEDLLTSRTPNESESRLQEWRAAYERLRRAFIIVVLLLCSVIVVILLPWPTSSPPPPPPPLDTVGPEIPWSKVVFEKDEKFSAAASPDSDAAWAEMMPAGDGFVVIDDARQLAQLSQAGKETREGQVYDVSMWHQLHCLRHVRMYTNTMQATVNRSNAQQVFEVLLAPQAEHVLHCFDYLRQAIRCAGDMTLEWPRTEADGRRFAVDGWGIQHQCRDWDTMADYVEQHAVGRHHERMGPMRDV